MSTPIPAEITHTRAWLHDVFQQAGRGLPWPQQVALVAIEHAIALGMFGGLMVSAWALAEMRQGPASGPRSAEFATTMAALEEAALGPVPAQLTQAVRGLALMPGGPEVLANLAKSLGPVWAQLLEGAIPKPKG